MRFEIEGNTIAEATVAASTTQNIKVDARLAYVAPAVTGPVVASLNQPNTFSLSPVAGAAEYDVKISGIDSTAWTEGAETGTLGRVIDRTSSAYSLSSSTYASSGSRSFYLTFPIEFEDQSFEIDRELLLSSASKFEFDCRFRWVTVHSKLYAEISTDEGASWAAFWERAGTGTSGDTAFSHYALPLADYAGTTARFRFRFRHHNTAFGGPETYLGVYLDNVKVSNSSEITDATVTTIAGSAEGFTLQPEKAGIYRMTVRPESPAPLPYGPPLIIEARSLPTVVIEETQPQGNNVAVTFLVENGLFSTMALEGSSRADGGWSKDPTASLTNLGGGRYRFTANSAKSVHQFYRVTGTVD